MATVKPELVDGHSYTDVLAGFEITRVFHVTDLTDDPNRQLIEAVNDPGIPPLNALYPGTIGILCVRRDVVPAGPNAARVTCTYSANTNVSTFNQPFPSGNDGQDVKQISASVRETTTTRNRENNPMVLSPPAGWSSYPPYLSEARILAPVSELLFERTESSPAVARARSLVGKVNQDVLGGGSYQQNELLFVSLDAQSDDGGRLWRCSYVFRYAVNGWLHNDVWRTPEGKVPDNATGFAWEVFPQALFAPLGLDFDDAQSPIT